MTTSPAIIEHMEHSKNPFERIHWQTCSLFWEYEVDLEELYETGKECYEVGAQMLEALVHLDTTIMPEERKYDEWGYCRIHHDILCEFDAVVKEGIEAAKLEKER